MVSVNKNVDNKINDAILERDEEHLNYDKNLDNKWRELYKLNISEDLLKNNIDHHNYIIDLISKYAIQLSQNSIPRLAEVGIGTATMSIHFSKIFYDVLGIDIDPIIVSRAMDANKRLGGYAKFICLDAFDLQKFFKERLFDVAFSQGTMEHFDNDNIKKIIDAQLHIAKCVIFSVPSINYPYSEFGNERKMNISEWEVLLKSFGYTVEHIAYYQEGDWHIAVVISS